MEEDCVGPNLSSESLDALIMHPGVGTVGEVLRAWVSPKSTLLDVLREVQCLLDSRRLQLLLHHSAPYASELQNKDGFTMLSLVGEKITKALASEYACMRYRGGDTSKLTNVTRVLISSDSLSPAVLHCLGPSLLDRKLFMSFLALVMWADGIRLAGSILLPLFKYALEEGQYAIDLPAVLCILRPGMASSKVDHGTQVSWLVEELEKRHVYVKKIPYGTNDVDNTEQYTVSVHYGDKQELCKEKVGLKDYYKIVVEEGRKLQNEIYRKKTGQGESLPSQVSWKMWMNDVQGILRFRPTYRDLFEPGFLNKVTNSNCWVPLHAIRCLLSKYRKDTYGEPPSDEELQELLQQHDHFRRFQVGVCEVDGPFSGMQCARALYAHRGYERLCERIFSSFKEVENPDSCDKHAWLIVENSKEIVKIVKDDSYSLYATTFFSVVSDDSLCEFNMYRKLTPLDEQYDGKLGKAKSIFFLEFCLRAAVRSGRMRILEAPPRDGSGAQWKVFPGNDSATQQHNCCVSAYYFTGCVAELEGPCMGEDFHALSHMDKFQPKLAVYWPLKNIKPTDLTPEECDRIFQNDRNVGKYGGENEDEMDNENSDISGDMQSSLKFFERSLKEMRLDVETVKGQVLTFMTSSSSSLLVSLPKKNADGIVYYNRQKDIGVFKKWIASLDLSYKSSRGNTSPCDNSEHTGCDEDVELFEIRKRCKWTLEEVQHIANELGLTDTVDLKLLQQALTRECECERNEESYEILEFIGDAVLDLLVIFDSFLLGKPWNPTVCTQVCCNEVLSYLLPNLVNTKLDNCYKDLPYKVKADMAEAIVGAVYWNGNGLDAVRELLCCLFANFSTNIPNSLSSEHERELITKVRDACPYLGGRSETLKQLYKFNCASLIDKDFFMDYVNSDSLVNSDLPSHYALRPFSRIQDKAFATHFTTGLVFSYRHMASIDTMALFNRILSVSGKGSFAFVNEIITEDTHLVIDFDGKDVFELDILNCIYEWFRERYHSKSSLLLMNCSGKSVVKGNMKYSYHIHFPQAVIRLSDLQNRMKDLRRYILHPLNHNTLIGDVVGFQYGRDTAVKQTIIGQVVFTPDYTAEELRILGDSARKQAWGFMDARSLMNLGATCKQCRKSVFSYLHYVSRDPKELASIFEVSPEFNLSSEDNSEDIYLVVRALWYSKDIPHAANKLFLVPKKSVSVINEGSKIMDAVVRKGEEKELTVTSFYNDSVTKQRQQCPFVNAFWESVIDDGVADSKKLRMYLNDKYDSKYGKENRPLFLDRVIFPSGTERKALCNINAQRHSVTSRKKTQRSNTVDGGECEIAHASALRLTSLRCPEYRDVHGQLRSAWTEGSNATESLCAVSDVTARDDRLPSFAAYPYNAAVPCDGWELWRSGVCELDTGAGKTGALLPLYWTHDPPRAYIGGEVLLGTGESLSLFDTPGTATGGSGITLLSQLLTPHLRVTNAKVKPTFFNKCPENVFPLFCLLGKKPFGNADDKLQSEVLASDQQQ